MNGKYSPKHFHKSISRNNENTINNFDGIVATVVLAVIVVTLGLFVICLYMYVKSHHTKNQYRKISLRQKPSLKITLPSRQQTIEENPSLERKCFPTHHVEFAIPPKTPNTPMTPYTPVNNDKEDLKYFFSRSISAPAEKVFVSKDRNADGLWRTAVKKAAASQFLTTKPKTENKISHCASGKIKLSLKYNQHGLKELYINLLECIDLPLSKETGITAPFVKVYLYPQTAHTFQDTNKIGFRVAILNYPSEQSCSFTGCPIDKLCGAALKFVILDYDRFSRSEFVADCVLLLDEVSLEGEIISKHLSVRKTQPDKDVGSLLVSLCYQPSGSRICITVLKASGLPENMGGHFLDYFVKISLMYNGVVLDKRRTRVIKKTACPVFNERVVFPVDSYATINSLIFLFEVIRNDSKLKQEKIANVILANHCRQRQVTPHEIQHFNEMISSPQRQIAEWHKLVI
ncbi:synaptotagmin-7-like [Hydractinia symbiolongicarpus]|uniref:synaptotagmin-7-like n=1 Tax=Hydractinia symbiolongicarpus TaxID=13093 RepID=UPI002549F726|nr:synaptotagmin-7-like [Hydractinia symbiolongicarpus]